MVNPKFLLRIYAMCGVLPVPGEHSYMYKAKPGQNKFIL